MEATEAASPSQEFNLAQARLSELVSEHKRLSEMILQKEHEKKMSILTLRELESQPEDKVAYRTLGNAFLMDSLGGVRERLHEVEEQAQNDKDKLIYRRSQLEETIKEAESKARALYEDLKRQPPKK